jgi:enoyl-CoA hydratase/carnithine racemase
MQNVKYIVLRGAGGNFSSGNDLNNFRHEELVELDKGIVANAMADILCRLT